MHRLPTPNERAEALLERVLQALRSAMSGHGVKWFADELGLAHATLLHKIEPDNPADMLTLRQFARLLVRLDAGAVMRPLAAELGGQWLSLPDAARIGPDLHRLMTEASREFGDVAAALLAGSDPTGPGGRDWTAEEIDRLDDEVDEAVLKFRQIVAAARRARVAAIPAPARSRS